MTTTGLKEKDVVARTHQYLKTKGLADKEIVRLYTDTHNTLWKNQDLKPFQRFRIELEDFVVHPDLVGQLKDGETFFAIEAKGGRDMIRGLAQAELYQSGFQLAFLAAPATRWNPTLEKLAHRKNIGVIAVSDVVKITCPDAQMPKWDIFRSIARQMDSLVQVPSGNTFKYNVPTHYLVWAIALEPGVSYRRDALLPRLGNYPMVKDWFSTVQGAQRLGLARIQGKDVELTPIGAAVKDILPQELTRWSEIHNLAAPDEGKGQPLAELHLQAAAALRLLLLQDPVSRLIINGLEELKKESNITQPNLVQLAKTCSEIDAIQAQVFFLTAKAAERLAARQGRIQWEHAQGQDYQVSAFYMYKSLLKHAGILSRDIKLGYASNKNLKPTKDLWQLA